MPFSLFSELSWHCFPGTGSLFINPVSLVNYLWCCNLFICLGVTMNLRCPGLLNIRYITSVCT